MAVFLTRLPYTNARFVLASWDFPDEYGQGIEGFYIYENSTGSWLHYDDPIHGYYQYDQGSTLDWYLNASIKLGCFTWFNNTHIEVADADAGKLYQRHSVTVSTSTGTVFSQENFTYESVNTGADPMWYYEYEIILNFLMVAGALYTVVVTYEIFD